MMSDLEPSDIMLLIDFGLALFLALYFAMGYPRSWWRDRLGWVIFGYAVTTVSFIGLIAYAIIFEQKVIEPVRFVVGFAMAGALAWKTWAVYRERREARLESRAHKTKEHTVSTPNFEAVKAATDIWYKGKRVLRTAFTTLLTVLPLIPQVVLIIQGQWSAEWLTGVAAQAVAINAALTAIIALPTVNAWLIKIGLGSVPKDAVVVTPSTGSAAVVRDPKAQS